MLIGNQEGDSLCFPPRVQGKCAVLLAVLYFYSGISCMTSADHTLKKEWNPPVKSKDPLVMFVDLSASTTCDYLHRAPLHQISSPN